MNGLILGAMLALSMPQQTDTTFALDGARFLDVEALGGSITVDVWDEDRVRIQAEHSTRTFVEIERGREGISVESEARRGPANLVDFRITVPRRLELRLEAQYGDVSIDGADGAVTAETLQGDVRIRGGRGTIKVESTMGNILVEGADGRIEIESSAADIRVVDSTGEIFAETAGGTIVLENVDPRAVDVGSTGGRVYYAGTFRQGGTYFFGAHGGSITIVVPEGTSASLNVATVHGSITSNLNGEAQSLKGGERHQILLGEGGALVEAETYGGRIRLVRAGTEGSEAPERRIRERDERDLEHALALGAPTELGSVLSRRISSALAPRVAVEVGPSVSAALAPSVHVDVGEGAHGYGYDYSYDYDYQYEYEYDYEYDYDYEYHYEYEHSHDHDGDCEHDTEPVEVRDLVDAPAPAAVPAPVRVTDLTVPAPLRPAVPLAPGPVVRAATIRR